MTAIHVQASCRQVAPFNAVPGFLVVLQVEEKRSMFPNSSQLKFWTFSGTTELNKLKLEANTRFRLEHGRAIPEAEHNSYFLTAPEEKLICRHYEYVLKEFCGHFQPPMPICVVGTSIMFLKRFYLHTSVMDYHPKDLVYTFVYLACKVEEFNVSIRDFVANMTGDKEAAADAILSQELLVMHHLNYHLTVHNPFRPLEGLLIDIKTRCRVVDDAEKLRKGAEDFLDRSLNTDVQLIFAPSQIALAAVLSSASKIGLNLDSYVSNTLLGAGDKESLMKTVEHIKRIRYIIKNQDSLDREHVRSLEQKLKVCRNNANNPYSDEYQKKMLEILNEDDDRRVEKRRKLAEVEKQEEEALLGV